MILPENIWNSPVIRKRLAQEALFESNRGVSQLPHYWMTVPEGDSKAGNIVLKNYETSPFNIDPHILQQEFALGVRKGLQREEHRDGLWIAGWTHPPSHAHAIRVDGDNVWGRLIMIWLDEDADPQFTLESDMRFIEIVENGVGYYIRLAAEAFQTWDEHYGKKATKSDFALKEDQTSKAALEALR